MSTFPRAASRLFILVHRHPHTTCDLTWSATTGGAGAHACSSCATSATTCSAIVEAAVPSEWSTAADPHAHDGARPLLLSSRRRPILTGRARGGGLSLDLSQARARRRPPPPALGARPRVSPRAPLMLRSWRLARSRSGGAPPPGRVIPSSPFVGPRGSSSRPRAVPQAAPRRTSAAPAAAPRGGRDRTG